MSRVLVINNCMECKHFKIIGDIDKYGDINDIYYCIYDIDNPITLFKFKEDEKRTDENFIIPDDKCKLPIKE